MYKIDKQQGSYCIAQETVSVLHNNVNKREETFLWYASK